MKTILISMIDLDLKNTRKNPLQIPFQNFWMIFSKCHNFHKKLKKIPVGDFSDFHAKMNW